MNNEDINKLRDPKFYLERFCKIKTKKRGMEPFILNEAQKDIFNTIRKHNRVIILKCRQLGFSTGVTGYFYVDTIMNPGTTTVLVGYNNEMITELLDKIKTFYQTTPLNMRPTIKYDSRTQMSFPKIDSKIMVLPCTMDVGRGYTIHNLLCLSGDVRILCKNGNAKKIKELSDGEMIMNSNGGYSNIDKLIKRKNYKKIISINTYNYFEDLILTEDHKVLTREHKTGKPIWKEAGDIKKGDYLAFPYFQCRDRFKKINIDNFLKKGYETRSISCENEIKLDYNFGLFVGWYLAEGHIDKNKTYIKFCIDIDEVNEIKKIIEPFKNNFGKIHIKTKKNSRSTVVTLYGSNFARFIESLFGRTDNKIINDCIWYWTPNFCKGLLYGLFCGDGCFTTINKVVLTNINEKIINQTKRLLISLRIGIPGIYKSKSFRYGKRGQDRYDLNLNGKGNYKFRKIFNLPLPEYNDGRSRWKKENHPNFNLGFGYWRRGKKYYWNKVKEIKNINDIDFVYDISLKKNPHSFVTVSGVVHNCTELSSWEKADEKMAGLEESVPINGTIVIESTPRGVGNLYHRIWMTKNEYVKKRYDWWWGKEMGYTKELMEQKKRTKGLQWWAQEYGCDFLESGRPVFAPAIIKEQRKNVLKIDEEYNGLKIYKDEDGWVIYKEPEDGDLFVCGADVAEGVAGGDNSAGIVWDRKTGEEVAFYRGLISPDKFGEVLNKKGRKYNNALMVVEINNHGLTTITILKQLIYPSLYFRQARFETLGSTPTDRLGWRTTTVTRPLLIDEFAQATREKVLTIHSKELLDEMSVFIYNDNGNMVPSEGFKDDTVFAAGIGFQGFKILYDKPLTQIDHTKHLPKSFSY